MAYRYEFGTGEEAYVTVNPANSSEGIRHYGIIFSDAMGKVSTNGKLFRESRGETMKLSADGQYSVCKAARMGATAVNFYTSEHSAFVAW